MRCILCHFKAARWDLGRFFLCRYTYAYSFLSVWNTFLVFAYFTLHFTESSAKVTISKTPAINNYLKFYEFLLVWQRKTLKRESQLAWWYISQILIGLPNFLSVFFYQLTLTDRLIPIICSCIFCLDWYPNFNENLIKVIPISSKINVVSTHAIHRKNNYATYEGCSGCLTVGLNIK